MARKKYTLPAAARAARLASKGLERPCPLAVGGERVGRRRGARRADVVGMWPEVNSTLASLAARYLRPWRDSGISLAAVDEAHFKWADYRDEQWGGYVPLGTFNNRLLRINIIGNRLYYFGCVGSTSMRRLARQEAALRLLQSVLDARGLPDVDLVLSISDRPTVPCAAVRPGSAPPPVFAYALTPSHFAIPFPPVSFDPRRWAPLHARMLTDTHPPLQGRKPVALWRGSCNSLCDMMRGRKQCSWARDAALLPRTALLRAASRCPRVSDVGITTSHRHCHGYTPKRPVPMSQHAHHALVVHVDGNGFSGRLDELLTLGAAVLKQDSPFTAYYYPLLRAGTHYHPLHRNLSDLCRSARSLAHSLKGSPNASSSVGGPSGGIGGGIGRAETLANGAAAFARAYLAPAGVEAYVHTLLRQYAALQRFTPAVHPRAVAWSGGGVGHAGGRATRRRAAPMGRSAGVAAGGTARAAAAAAVPPARRASVERCADERCCRRHPKARGCPSG